MAESSVKNLLQEANSIYNLAEQNEKEGNNNKAIDYYKQAQNLYFQIQAEKEKEDVELGQSMKMVSDTCERKIKIISLREELLPMNKE